MCQGVKMITIKNDSNRKYKDIINSKLRENNRSKSKWLRENLTENINLSSFKQSNFLAFDKDNLIGGAIGYELYNWYYLDLMYVDESYRNKGVGTRLLKQIDEYVIANNLSGIRTETWDFQAKGFYEKNGFVIFGEISNCPPGTIEYHLKKEF